MSRNYVELFKQGLPKGAFWTRDHDTIAHQLYTALSAEAERLGERAEAFLQIEADPRATTEMIEDWEEALGLPDPEIDPAPETIEERRALVTARWIARGAQWGGGSRPFLTQILVALGFAEADITFRVPAARAFVCGESACGEQPVNDPQAVFYTEIIARSVSDTADAAAKREMRRYVLASYQIIDPDLYRAPQFAFPLALYSDATIEGAAAATFTNPVTGGQESVPSGDVGTIWIDGPNTEFALYGDA